MNAQFHSGPGLGAGLIATSFRRLPELIAFAALTALFETAGVPALGWCWGWFAEVEPIPRWCLALPISVAVAALIVIIWKRKVFWPNSIDRDFGQQNYRVVRAESPKDKSEDYKYTVGL
jgi:hypothetical protein